MQDYKDWRHVFKLDPNKKITDDHLARLCQSGTDAVIVGGTDGVTFDNMIDLLSRIRRYTVPCILEVSTLHAVSPGFDYYFIPTVLNSPDSKWFKDLHHEAVKEYEHLLNWEELVMEGYCILNGQSKVAQLTSAHTNITDEEVEAYATLAEKMFQLPIFYVEYSGQYGDPQLLAKIKQKLTKTRLFYGGGINNFEKAQQMAQYADTIVVGNAIYEDFERAIDTVAAVK